MSDDSTGRFFDADPEEAPNGAQEWVQSDAQKGETPDGDGLQPEMSSDATEHPPTEPLQNLDDAATAGGIEPSRPAIAAPLPDRTRTGLPISSEPAHPDLPPSPPLAPPLPPPIIPQIAGSITGPEPTIETGAPGWDLPPDYLLPADSQAGEPSIDDLGTDETLAYDTRDYRPSRDLTAGAAAVAPVWTEPSSRSVGSGMFLALMGGLAGAAIAVGALYASGALDQGTTIIETVRTEIATPTEVESTTAAAIAAKVTPAIVTVRVAGGTGSGVIYNAADGYVITNEHVVDSATRVEVVLSDGRTYDGDVIGVDKLTDLAVIDIDADSLTEVAVGETDTLVVGDPAYAVGNPLALIGTPTVTEGIVSAFDRRVQGATEAETLYGMLQTDAPFTRGSSGGSLVDRQGRLIGITTAVAVSDIGAEGLGFATPVEIVKRVVDEIIESGSSTHGFLGINGGTKFRETSDQGQRPIGVEVIELLDPSAAGEAGLEIGDVITQVDGHPVDTMQELISRLRRYSANQSIEVDIIETSGSDSTVDVKLGDRS